MNKREVFGEIIHNTIYRNVVYPHRGNNYILAANLMLDNIGIRDIDMIYKLAKIIEEHSTYDHAISDDDFDIIFKLFNSLVKEYFNNLEKELNF